MSTMLREIRQQPDSLRRMLRATAPALAELTLTLRQHRPRLVVLAARGTSDNAAQFGRYLIEITTGIPVSLAAPSVHSVYKSKLDYRDTLVIGISQSGASPDVNIVVESARKHGALTLGITNEPGSPLAASAHHTLLVSAGREHSVAATKTYTGQLLSMYLVARALGAPITDADLATLPDLATAALTLEPQVSHLAGRFRFMNHAVAVGRGLNYANAFELALKLMETCYVVAERFSSADFLHGPIAMIDPNFPVFAFAPRGPAWPGLRDTLNRLHGMRCETVVITDQSNSQAPGTIVIPKAIPELYTPIPYIIPAQLLAAHLAREKGLNPDKPRSLSKVTHTV